MRGWWNMPCWNGLSQHQQRMLIEHGGLSIGYVPMGSCTNGAEVEVATMWDEAPGPRFYCLACAVRFLGELVPA